jgi:repressor LexA
MVSTKQSTLTTKQTALLNYIRDYFERNHYAPTYEEIRVGLGWSTKSLVDYHLKALEKAGCIEREFASPRTIVLTETNSITTQEA